MHARDRADSGGFRCQPTSRPWGQDPNAYLFAGEPLDPNSGFYYNRARWAQASLGRFASADSFGGSRLDPSSLHKYQLVRSNPTAFSDPTGLYTPGFGYAVEKAIRPHYEAEHLGDAFSFGGWASRAPILKPDILNLTRLQFLEIKPLSFRGVASGAAKLWIYSAWLGEQGFTPDIVWEPPSPLQVQDRQVLVFNVQGILFYTDRLHLEPKLITVVGFEELFGILRQEQGTGRSRIMNEYVFVRQSVVAAAMAGIATAILFQSMSGLRISTLGFA